MNETKNKNPWRMLSRTSANQKKVVASAMSRHALRDHIDAQLALQAEAEGFADDAETVALPTLKNFHKPPTTYPANSWR